ncbi:tetratricopeptide repeat protein [Ignavibacterium album]|uniref:CHAT domain-containing protein n=1 Tax=Ignavibacterium album TaxID=591197 RepID=UPI0026F2E279|nr:CHAT domain-containing tetratricopeptide repeat protein [Ignavibacterium album]
MADTVIVNEWLNKGKELLDKAKYDSSITLFQKSIEVYKNLLEQNDEQKLWIKYLQAKNSVGYILCLLGKYDESFKYLTETRKLCIEKLGENNLTAAQIYQSSGIYYDYTEDLNKSLEMFQKALELRINLLGENHSDVADTYNSLGIIYSKRSNKEKALQYFFKSLGIRKNIYGDEHSLTAASYNNIGIHYFDKGDYGKALEYYQRSLNIRLKILGEHHPLTASNFNNIGNCYNNMDEYDKAEEMHLKSLSIRKSVLGEKHNLVATSYNNLGLVYWKKKELKKALDYFTTALNLRLEIFKQNHPSVAQSYMNIGLIYYDMKNYDKAVEQFSKSLAVWKNLGESKLIDISKTYQNISEAYYKKSEYDSALIAIQKSIIESVMDFNDNNVDVNPHLNYVKSEVQLLNSLKIKSKILLAIAENQKIGNEKQIEILVKSFEVMSLADSLIDKMIRGFENENSKYFLGEKSSSIFEQAVETSLRLYNLTGNNSYKERAFYFIEKSKAAVLQQGILESKAKQFANISAEILEKEKTITEDLFFYESQLQLELQKKSKLDSLKVFDYQNKVFELKNQYKKLISEIEYNYPVYYNLKYQSGFKTTADIQKLLPDDCVILDYFVGDKLIYIVQIGKDDFEISAIEKSEDFNSTVKTFYSSVIKADNKAYLKSSNKLSELLIKPIESMIINKKELIIIPHDVLFKIPFEALFTRTQNKKSNDFTKLNYLIKDFGISYHYSASLFTDSKEKTKNTATKNFIGFAPVFPKDNKLGFTISNLNSSLLAANDEGLRSVSVDGKTFDELKYSEWEVNSIIDLFIANKPKEINTAYFYADAKEDSFKLNVKDYKIVHIASHSFMNEEQPSLSGVIFAQPTDTNYTEDGMLYSSETYNLDLNAELMVLSSCESGLGKLFRGEGMMALNRGFLYSGVDNIIFSLWKIPDKHTSELMIEFYRQMISGKSYSESLRAAKLRLIKNQLTARPRSWAGFLLISGD